MVDVVGAFCQRSTSRVNHAHWGQASWLWPLTHPIWWVSLIVLVLNDHFLKGAGILPGWVTGKLSDFAGLIVAPVLVVSLFRIRSWTVRVFAFAAVVVPFVLINLWADAALVVEAITAKLAFPWRIWSDPTDLAALAVLPVAVRIVDSSSRPVRQPCRFGGKKAAYVGAVLGGLACLATSNPADRFDPKMPIHIVNRSMEPRRVCVFHITAPINCENLRNGPDGVITPTMFVRGQCTSAETYELRTGWIDPTIADKGTVELPDGRKTCGAVVLKIAGMVDTVVFQRESSGEASGDGAGRSNRLRLFVDVAGDDVSLDVPSSVQVWNPPWKVD